MKISGSKKNNKTTGDLGETLAAEYLENNGYMISEKNYRAGKIGEIDIIAEKEEFLCFIEVKTRKSTYFGMPSESVNWKKQNNIKRIAQMFLKSKGLKDKNIRFDIVEVLLEDNKKPYINLIENAF